MELYTNEEKLKSNEEEQSVVNMRANQPPINKAPKLNINFKENIITINHDKYDISELAPEDINYINKLIAPTREGLGEKKVVEGRTHAIYYTNKEAVYEMRFISDDEASSIAECVCKNAKLIAPPTAQEIQQQSAHVINQNFVEKIEEINSEQGLAASELAVLHLKAERINKTINSRIDVITAKNIKTESVVKQHTVKINEVEVNTEAHRLYNKLRQDLANIRINALNEANNFSWNWVRGACATTFTVFGVGVGATLFFLGDGVISAGVISTIVGAGIISGGGYLSHKAGNTYHRYKVNKQCRSDLETHNAQFNNYMSNLLNSEDTPPVRLREYNSDGTYSVCKDNLSEQERFNLAVYDKLKELIASNPINVEAYMNMKNAAEVSQMLPRDHQQNGYGTFGQH